jgi:hypothetical protein
MEIRNIKKHMKMRHYKNAGDKVGKDFGNLGNSYRLKDQGEKVLGLLKETDKSFNDLAKYLVNHCIIEWSKAVGDLRNDFTRNTCKELAPLVDCTIPNINPEENFSSFTDINCLLDKYYPAVEELDFCEEYLNSYMEGFVSAVTRNHPTIQQGTFNIICQMYRFWGDKEINNLLDEIMNQGGVFTPMI